MKHIIILGDGMADHPVERLGGKTLLQYADKPYMDMLAKKGRTGRLSTVPEGFPPGSEVANTSIMGYDLNKVYEGRGPLEAASIGYEMSDDDFAIRCNIITLQDGRIITHNGGNLETDDAKVLIDYLNEHLSNDRVQFIAGIQYRHLLVIKGGNKHVVCNPPHDHPNEEWRPLLVTAEPGWENKKDVYVDAEQAKWDKEENAPTFEYDGKKYVSYTWWGAVRRAAKEELYVYANSFMTNKGLIQSTNDIEVEGATGLANTNYEGKAQAAIDALRKQDFVFVHVEATDEAGHDGDLELKLRAINYLDHRLIEPIYNEVRTWDEPVCIAVLPDHPTPVEMRIHINEPVPFIIYAPGMEPDSVLTYDEESCKEGYYGLLCKDEFINALMAI